MVKGLRDFEDMGSLYDFWESNFPPEWVQKAMGFRETLARPRVRLTELEPRLLPYRGVMKIVVVVMDSGGCTGIPTKIVVVVYG